METEKPVFFLPNMASMFQRIDQEVIKDAKRFLKAACAPKYSVGAYLDEKEKIKKKHKC